MRSRMARVLVRVSVLAAVAGGASGTATAHATSVGPRVVAQATAFEAFTPVVLTAIGLGIAGMIVGVLRRKKIPVQPENQRE